MLGGAADAAEAEAFEGAEEEEEEEELEAAALLSDCGGTGGGGIGGSGKGRSGSGRVAANSIALHSDHESCNSEVEAHKAGLGRIADVEHISQIITTRQFHKWIFPWL